MEDYIGPGGWVKVHRKILTWQWVTSANHVAVFIQLLLHANYKESKWRKETLLPGQVLTGRKQLMEWTGLSEKQIRRCLDDLEESGELGRRRTNQYSIITLLKWDEYQGEDQPRAVGGQSEGSPRATSKKANKYNKGKNNINKGPSPLAFLFKPEDEIQVWLLTGSHKVQSSLVEKYSHHVLAEEVFAAYLWQSVRETRKSDMFLVNWMKNKNTHGLGSNQAKASFKSKSHGVTATPENPTGNPYRAQRLAMNENGETA